MNYAINVAEMCLLLSHFPELIHYPPCQTFLPEQTQSKGGRVWNQILEQNCICVFRTDTKALTDVKFLYANILKVFRAVEES